MLPSVRRSEHNPDLPGAYHEMGMTFWLLGKREEAVKMLKTTVELSPRNEDALVTLGTVLKDMGQLEEAAVPCRRAILVRPDNPQSHYALGMILRKQGKLPEAAQELKIAEEQRRTAPGPPKP